MHKIDSDGATLVIPTPEAVGSTVGYFQEGNPSLSQQATKVSADWLNAVQDEIANVIESAGLTLDKTDRTQLAQAIGAAVVGTPTEIDNGDSPYTVLAGDTMVIADATAGAVAVTLANATGSGRKIRFMKSDSSANAVTITSNSIMGTTAVELGEQYANVTLWDYNNVWIQLNG